MGDQETVSPKLGKYRLYEGDVMAGLAKIPDGKIQCCVTSPPYYGLRDYGHDGQIGLEETPEEYVTKLVKVFREVRRVLQDDGTLWLNVGDSYAGSWGNAGGHNRGKGTQREIVNGSAVKDQADRNGNFVPPGKYGFKDLGIKAKDLIGIPWRLAFALQADGWYLRQDIIWAKPNPMPESVRDRCTKAHEYVFLMTKNSRYFYNFDAMQEPAVCAGQSRGKSRNISPEGMTEMAAKQYDTRNRRSVWSINTRPYKEAHFATMPPALAEICVVAGSLPGSVVLDPFGGSGTTAEVAMRHGRNVVLCELNPEYCEIARKRLGAVK